MTKVSGGGLQLGVLEIKLKIMEQKPLDVNEVIEKKKKEQWESIYNSIGKSDDREAARAVVHELAKSLVGDEIGYYFILDSHMYSEDCRNEYYDELVKVANSLESEGSYTELAMLRFLQEKGIEYNKDKITETINSVAERKDEDFINASSEYARLIAFAIKNNIPFDRDVVKSFIGKRMGTYLEPLRDTGLLDPEIVEKYDSGERKLTLG